MFIQKKIQTALLLLFTCIILTACSDQAKPDAKAEEETTEKAKEQKADETASATDEIPKASLELEGMIAQKSGKLVGQHMAPEVEAAETKNFWTYHNFYEDTFEPIMQEELSNYFLENNELDADQIYDYLVYQLGSGQYHSFYDQLASYDHGYEMPELPDGKDEIEVAKARKTNIVILMDASGSMKAEVAGGVKMALAKEAIEAFTSELEDDVHVSLLAYGHKGRGVESEKELSCSSIDEVYPLGAYEETAFHEAMDSFQASGWTPLAGAMEKAGELLSSYGNEKYRNIVYIVSDGIETCGGDPIAAAKKLHEGNIEAKVNIIGFDVDDEGQNQLREAAEAGGGKYATVRDKSGFEDVLLKKWKPSLMQVWSQQGVTLGKLVDQMTELQDIYGPLSNLSDREAIRINGAARFLRGEGLISEEAAQHVMDRVEEMKELRGNHFRGLYDEKSAEAKQARDEIDAAVQAWKDKWYEELEKE
ncbi:VWA domain-containing protein [Sporosarcina sp. ACRSM]|uniref:vWA domain-containing protein n=1 Tax=Sporosarcina sp. ACRSM TaxID=2918216 RepID=UPI001EF5873E|nr:VWA domain-containing protein [Sporosarcina sp. ACRSM]MCG7335273.1 VWA domain-containing protein [Sporosarcina sp. ACRSM]